MAFRKDSVPEWLRGAGLYIGFVAVVFIGLCIVFAGNRVSPDDPRNLCPKELKNSLEFNASSVLGYEVADLIHCFGGYGHTYEFLYDDGDSLIPFNLSRVDMVEHKIIIDYELSHYPNDPPALYHYQFLVVDRDSERIKEKGVTVK